MSTYTEQQAATVRPLPASMELLGRASAALLALAVSWIHVLDQGGLTGLKDPAYLGWGYRMLEVTGVVVAILLFTQRRTLGWLLAVGVAVGPLVGLIVSRTVGLPNAMDDIGNWTETLEIAAMIVESSLLAIAVAALTTARSTRP
jgi:hypothetical protein